MAKTRMINTRFWSDNFVAALTPIDRYIFLYLMTNEHTNIAGVYELPLRTLCFEANVSAVVAKKALARLSTKVAYIDGWVAIKNFQKHQSTTSETVRRGIEIEMSKIPPEIREKINLGYGMDTVSDRIIYPNPNPNPNPTEVDTPAQNAKDFFSLGESYQKVRAYLAERIPPEIVDEELNKFVLYWTEPNSTGKRVRWEQEKVFEVRRRITTWFNKVKNYKVREINRGRGIA